MAEMNSDRFVEEVKTILSGYISDKDTVSYLALKINRLHKEVMASEKDHTITPAEYIAKFKENER